MNSIVRYVVNTFALVTSEHVTLGIRMASTSFESGVAAQSMLQRGFGSSFLVKVGGDSPLKGDFEINDVIVTSLVCG